ncbi:hypothetical protein NUSPORA_02829 [Nucleospora cyclopteri]
MTTENTLFVYSKPHMSDLYLIEMILTSSVIKNKYFLFGSSLINNREIFIHVSEDNLILEMENCTANTDKLIYKPSKTEVKMKNNIKYTLLYFNRNNITSKNVFIQFKESVALDSAVIQSHSLSFFLRRSSKEDINVICADKNLTNYFEICKDPVIIDISGLYSYKINVDSEIDNGQHIKIPMNTSNYNPNAVKKDIDVFLENNPTASFYISNRKNLFAYDLMSEFDINELINNEKHSILEIYTSKYNLLIIKKTNLFKMEWKEVNDSEQLINISERMHKRFLENFTNE